MDTVKKLNKWANAHTSYPIDALRIGLGVFLFFKGTTFLTNSQYLLDLFEPFNNFGGAMLVIHYVAFAHLVGGVLIAVGLLTRLSIVTQLPILFGAILINFVGEMNYNNFVVATLCLGLCIFFLIYGSGKHSADYFFKMGQ